MTANFRARWTFIFGLALLAMACGPTTESLDADEFAQNSEVLLSSAGSGTDCSKITNAVDCIKAGSGCTTVFEGGVFKECVSSWGVSVPDSKDRSKSAGN